MNVGRHTALGWWRLGAIRRPEWSGPRWHARRGWLYRGTVRRYALRLGPVGFYALRFRTDFPLRGPGECE
jgi:hypothetical protein